MPNQGFFAVFDGHGGRSAAAWCGEHFHKVLARNLAHARSSGVRVPDPPHTPVAEIMDQTFAEVDSCLTADQGIYSGCTAIVALLRPESPPARGPGTGAEGMPRPSLVLHTANVGDSRAVLCRAGRPLRLSYDHKGSDLVEQQRVREAGGFILNERVNGMLAITRALGDAEMKDYISGRPYTCEVVLDRTTDSFLILACDGLWDVCSDQMACDLIADVEDPQVAAEKLVSYGLANGSYDNLSVLTVRFVDSDDADGPDLPPSSASEAPGAELRPLDPGQRAAVASASARQVEQKE